LFIVLNIQRSNRKLPGKRQSLVIGPMPQPGPDRLREPR
jgi:hypothetical protein